MKKKTNDNPFVSRNRRRTAYLSLVVCLAILVTAGVAGAFHLTGIAKTYHAVLTCTAEPKHGPGYADFFVHTHNEDCYDENGNLWCTLPEIEAHEHDADCYTTTQELICTTPESEGHHHTADCHTRVRGDLTCELSTEPVYDEDGNLIAEGHVHTDACYTWSEELTCGKTEGEGAHHHDDACYQSVTKLTCKKPVVVLHTHDEDCYTEDEDGDLHLTCGMLEVTEHVHDETCFTVYEQDDDEPEETGNKVPADGATEETVDTNEVNNDLTEENSEDGESGLVFLYPEEEKKENETGDDIVTDEVTTDEVTTDEVTTDEVTTDDVTTDEVTTDEVTTDEVTTDDVTTDTTEEKQEEPAPEPETPPQIRSLGGERRGATVLAEIPDGVLNEYAKLELADYDANLAKATILSKVNENAAEGEARDISAIYVIDIGFTAGGEAAFPNGEAPIRITLRANEIRSMTAPKLYHLYSGTAELVEDAVFDTAAGTVTFTSYGFSPFAVVDLTGEDPAGIDMPAQNFHDWTDEVDVYVEADEGAFPAGTTMLVTAVPQEEVIDALNEAAPNAMVRNVQAVDITFYDAEGNEIEPATAIRVKMSKKTETPAPAAPAESTESVVMHVDNAGSAQIVENATVDNSTAEFESDSFSKYIFADLITEEVLDSLGNTYTISVTYGPEAKIPENSGLEVSEILETSEEYREYVARTESALGMGEGTAGYIRLFDIKIEKDGEKIQPADGTTVDVKIELKDAQADSLSVVHFADESDTGSVVQSTETEGQTVSFAADGFSVYAVVDEGSTGDNARMTVEFYNGTTLIDSIYVKNSDILLGDGERDPSKQYIEDIIYDPGVGTVQSGKIFKGWIQEKENYTVADAENALTIADIRQWAADHNIVENETVKFYALIYTSMKIDYRDEDEISLGTDNILLPASETSSTYTVQHAYTPKDDLHHFEGWTVKEGSSKIQGYTEGDIYENGTTVTITGDVTFSVNAPLGHWLVFHEAGGTYIAPKFIKSGENTVAPTETMTKLGYSFGGWYADEGLTTPFNFGSEINDRTHVYAKWTPNATAPYTVVIWKQNLDATDYDFEEAISLTGNSNSTITTVTQQGSGNSAYARVNGVNKIYEGFYLKQFDQNKTVAPEGTTIVNVYYNRIEYTLRFFYARTYTYNNRTYVQVNCNNEGFLQGRRNNRNLNASLTYRNNSGDYRRVSGTNTWKDVNNNTINGNPLNLVSTDFLSKEEVSTGTVNINNVTTDVCTSRTNRTTRTVNTTYYYVDVKVRYEQSLDSLWPVPNSTFISQTMTNYNDGTDTGNYTTISPLLQGSWATGNNIGGKYSTMNSELFANNDNTAYFLTYWRFENHYEYQYNVYFSALPGETGGVTYNGNRYILQSDKSYVVANGQGWGSGADTDSGNGYWDVGTVTFDGTNKVGRVDNQQQRTINVYYDRIQRNIEYFDGIYVDGNGNEIQNKSDTLLKTAGPILYGANISSYNEGGADYYTPEAPEGYVFEGWYADSAGLQPYTFASTMPMKDIKVYAKWRQIQYRVFLHPNAGTDASLDWGSDDQAMNFRRSYGDTISLPQGLRTGYEMVGWFTDEACTAPFDSALVLNDTTVTADYDKTVDMTDPMDKWGNGATTNADVNRKWITKKFDLYAKWRKVIDGALGIGVVYDANGGSNAPSDTTLYLDTAEATAQTASTPPAGKKFEYWVIQRWDADQGKYVDTNDKIYPGDTYIVLLDNAKQVISSWENPRNPTDISTTQDATHTKIHEATYTVQLRAEYLDAEQETPTHIWWFPNYNPNRTIQKNDNLKINQAVEIPAPPAAQGSNYKFLGWAKVPATTSHSHSVGGQNYAEADVLNLSKNDLFLTWHEEENGGYYTAVVDGEEKAVTKVAADEVMPYQDMYAVWECWGYLKVGKHFDVQEFYLDGVDMESRWHTLEFTIKNSAGEYVKVREETEGPNKGYYIFDGFEPAGTQNPPVIRLADFVRETGTTDAHAHQYFQYIWLPLDTYTIEENHTQADGLLTGYTRQDTPYFKSARIANSCIYGDITDIGSGDAGRIDNDYRGDNNYAYLKVVKNVVGNAPGSLTSNKDYYFIVKNDTLNAYISTEARTFTTNTDKIQVFKIKPGGAIYYANTGNPVNGNQIQVIGNNTYSVIELDPTTTPARTGEQSPELAGYSWEKAVSNAVTPKKDDNPEKTITITNTYTATHGSLKLVKLLDSTGSNPDGAENKKYEFTVKNSSGKWIKEDGTVSDTEVVIEVQPGADKAVIIRNLEPGTYTVTEKDGEFQGYEHTVTITVIPPRAESEGTETTEGTEESGTSGETGDSENEEENESSAASSSSTANASVDVGKITEVDVTNSYIRIVTTIYLNKVDKDNQTTLLPNAEFELYRKNAAGTYATDDTIDATKPNTKHVVTDGTLKIENLPSGDYKLVETKAPAGYVILTKEIYFTVNASATESENIITTTSDPNITAFTDPSIGASRKKTVATGDTLVIPNTPGVELPSTGGRGTGLFTAIGAILSGTAGAILTLRKRKA